jgi:Reverse transcriptase (RNA-dependent DNA polymerase)
MMGESSVMPQINTPNRTTLRKIVLKSSFKSVQASSLNFVHLNPGSAMQYIDEMNELFDGVDIQLIAISETWYKGRMTNTHVALNGFRVIRADRGGGRRGGGVAIYLKNNIRYKVIVRSEPTSPVDYLFIELRMPFPILVGVVYNPPTINGFDNFGTLLEDLIPKYSDVLLLGDFNHDILKTEKRITDFVENFKNINLDIISKAPTNFQGQPSCIDLFITNKPESVGLLNQIDLPGIITTHDLIYGSYLLPNIPEPNTLTHFYRDFKNINMEALLNDANCLDWSSFYATDDVNEKISIFNSSISNLFDIHVRTKKVIPKNYVNPWFNRLIETAIRERDICYAVWKTRKTTEDKTRLDNVRKNVVRLVKNAKRSYYARLLNPSLPSKILWKNLKSIGVTENQHDSGPIIFSPDQLNNFYCSSPVVDTPGTNLEQQSAECNQFSFQTVSLSVVKCAVRSIGSEAVGLDNIYLKFIKLFLSYILSPLTNILNTSISSKLFPNDWKTSKIIPVPKMKDPSILKDYRPISILPVLSKALEIVMRDQMISFCEEKGLLTPFQSGFRSGHSTTTALLKITDDILMDLDRKLLTILVLLDFSKAFDTVNHDLLLRKLKSFYFFSESAINFIRSYLSDRTQAVFANGSLSNFLPVTQGVPQGSVLGPLLFSLFINDIIKSIFFSQYHIYADDVQIYLSGPITEIVEIVDKINSDLKNIANWSSENGLSLNSLKTQAMIIAKEIPVSLPPVKVVDDIIPYSSKVKNLGIIMNSDLTWGDQVSSVVSGVYFTLNRLWLTADTTPTETRRRLVVALILPKLLSSDVIYSQSSKGNRDRLNKAYKACARYVYGNTRANDDNVDLVKLIMGQTLDKLHELRICTLIYKLISGAEPKYLREKLQTGRSARTGILIPPRHYYLDRENSFFIKGVNLWNSLPQAIKSARSVGAFKEQFVAHTLSQ